MVCNHKMNKKERLELLERLRLRHCCEHAVTTVLKGHELETVINVGEKTRASCLALLSDILEVDAIAARVSCGFSDVLTRYDCGQPYSIVYHCDDCKVNTFSPTSHDCTVKPLARATLSFAFHLHVI